MREHFEQRVSDARAGMARGAARCLVPLDRAGAAGGRCRVSHEAGRATAWRSTAARSAIRARAGRRGWSSCGRRSVAGEPEEPPDPWRCRSSRSASRSRAPGSPSAIAATIAAGSTSGERLEARDRPIRPGDIMVLVRRRTPFVGELVRALKERDVPVAGADRMRPDRAARGRGPDGAAASSCCCPRTI